MLQTKRSLLIVPAPSNGPQTGLALECKTAQGLRRASRQLPRVPTHLDDRRFDAWRLDDMLYLHTARPNHRLTSGVEHAILADSAACNRLAQVLRQILMRAVHVDEITVAMYFALLQKSNVAVREISRPGLTMP